MPLLLKAIPSIMGGMGSLVQGLIHGQKAGARWHALHEDSLLANARTIPRPCPLLSRRLQQQQPIQEWALVRPDTVQDLLAGGSPPVALPEMMSGRSAPTVGLGAWSRVPGWWRVEAMAEHYLHGLKVPAGGTLDVGPSRAATMTGTQWPWAMHWSASLPSTNSICNKSWGLIFMWPAYWFRPSLN